MNKDSKAGYFGAFILFHFSFFIDVGIALIGYLSASRWLGNIVKSIDLFQRFFNV